MSSLIPRDDFPSAIFFFSFDFLLFAFGLFFYFYLFFVFLRKRCRLALELQVEVEPYVQHVISAPFQLCASLKREFEMKPQLKVNPFSLGVQLQT